MYKIGIIGLFSLGLIIGCMSTDTINDALVNSNVERTIDITSQLVKITNKITMQNTGKSPQNYFIFAMEKETKPHISYIGPVSGEGKSISKFTVTKIPAHEDKLLWRIDFKDNLQPGKSIVVEIEVILTKLLNPYPAVITQKDVQLIQYNGNIYFYSPYETTKQTTTVMLGTKNIENYTKLRPVSISDTNLVYGPYNSVKQFSTEKLMVHYENNSPFLVVSNLERVIEVSHWGNIAVEETVNVIHKGAILKGSFSRYEYQRGMQSGVSSVKSFKTILPASASDAYYRDDIGNISTSHMRVMSDFVELDLRPRFPLFGGWKTKYTVGYNVPSYEYLYNNNDEFLLKMRIIDHVFDDMIVENIITKVILPEGSKNIQLKLPYPVQRLPDQLHFTYLDTVGRPVIIMRKNNLVEQHIQDFELHYTFPRVLMLQEPLLAVTAFYLLFLLVIIYVRLDFSITKNDVKKDD